jgi:hypothetical protein
MHVYVAENNFQGQSFCWEIDWNNFNYINYSGKDGYKGLSGYDGVDGTDGSDGSDGGDGKDGMDIDCFITAIEINPEIIPGFDYQYGLLLYIPQTEDLILTKLRRIKIDVSGGDGGNGGDGGDGGKATDSDKSDGSEGYPGYGGDGGNGGNGGNIHVYYHSTKDINIPEYLEVISHGGEPGKGGTDGYGRIIGPITAIVSLFTESKGDDGKNGTGGVITINEIAKEDYLYEISKAKEFERFGINIDELILD